jgi:hypothetical protein
MSEAPARHPGRGRASRRGLTVDYQLKWDGRPMSTSKSLNGRRLLGADRFGSARWPCAPEPATVRALPPATLRRPAIDVRRLDWARIADWTAHIIAGDLRPIVQAFTAHRADPPEMIWNPRPDQMTAAPLRFLAGHWIRLAGEAALPVVGRIDALELGPALGYLMLLDPVDGPLLDAQDFRYRLYGSTLAAISRFDMTGRLLSEYPASIYVAEFSMAAYRAVLERRQPLFTARNPVGAEETARWLRLALPFADARGTVIRLLAGTVAVRADGRLVR